MKETPNLDAMFEAADPFKCRHEGSGLPGCPTCDLMLEHVAAAYRWLARKMGATVAGPHARAAAEIGALVEQKQAAYGDAFGKSGQVMRLLYPKGIPPEKLDEALGVVRVLDKLFRLATDPDAFGESPWRDIAGYGLLGAVRAAERAKEQRP